MLKLLCLMVLLAPQPGWTQPSETVTELSEILMEFEMGLTNLNQGLMTVREGQKDLRMSLAESDREVIKLTVALNKLQEEPDKLRAQLTDFDNSFNDYKKNIEIAAEAQKKEIRILKIVAIGSGVVVVGGIVTAVIVAILK